MPYKWTRLLSEYNVSTNCLLYREVWQPVECLQPDHIFCHCPQGIKKWHPEGGGQTHKHMFVEWCFPLHLLFPSVLGQRAIHECSWFLAARLGRGCLGTGCGRAFLSSGPSARQLSLDGPRSASRIKARYRHSARVPNAHFWTDGNIPPQAPRKGSVQILSVKPESIL